MPHLRFRSVNSQTVREASEGLVGELARTMSISEDNFTFECVPTEIFERGRRVEGTPYVEVHWFARSQELQNKVAEVITDFLKLKTSASYITVVFHILEKTSYYENGSHFG